MDAPREGKTMSWTWRRLASGGFPGTTTEGPVGAGGGALGERSGFAALRAENPR